MPPSLAILNVLAPVLLAVYVNVATGVDVVRDTVVGVNVPPPPLSEGVTTRVPPIAPVNSTTNALEAAALTQESGPKKANVPRLPAAVYVKLAGLDNPPSFVAESVLTPKLIGVYVKVAVGVPEEILTEVGLNVPSTAVGVTVTVETKAPLAPTVNELEGVLTIPEEGPVIVTAVATAVTA